NQTSNTSRHIGFTLSYLDRCPGAVVGPLSPTVRVEQPLATRDRGSGVAGNGRPRGAVSAGVPASGLRVRQRRAAPGSPHPTPARRTRRASRGTRRRSPTFRHRQLVVQNDPALMRNGPVEGGAEVASLQQRDVLEYAQEVRAGIHDGPPDVVFGESLQLPNEHLAGRLEVAVQLVFRGPKAGSRSRFVLTGHGQLTHCGRTLRGHDSTG